jgi:uncharacterized membrane protein
MSQKHLVFYCIMIGICLGFLFGILVDNNFSISHKSSNFIPFLAFVSITISFVIGIIRYFLYKEKETD